MACGWVFEERDPWGVRVDAEAVMVLEVEDTVVMSEEGCAQDEAVGQSLHDTDSDEADASLGGKDEGDDRRSQDAHGWHFGVVRVGGA